MGSCRNIKGDNVDMQGGVRLSLSPLRNQEGKLGDVRDGGEEDEARSQCLQPHPPMPLCCVSGSVPNNGFFES